MISPRKIEPRHQAGLAHPIGQGGQDRAGARADVEHPIARTGGRLSGQNVAQHTLLVRGVQSEKAVVDPREKIVQAVSKPHTGTMGGSNRHDIVAARDALVPG